MDARSADARVLAPEAEPSPDWRQQLALLRRRLPLFASVAAGVQALAVLAILLTPSRYVASAEVMVDPRREQVVDMRQVLADAPTDSAAVDTEVEVLKSRTLAQTVAQTLRLDTDPEFNPALKPKGWPGWNRAPGGLQTSPARVQETVLERIGRRLTIARIGMTYVIAVSVRAATPDKAAMIANAFTTAYLQQQLDAKSAAARHASDWLSARLGGLRAQVATAEHAVERYKTAHGLMTLTDSQGATITEQEISNLDGQLASARGERAEAQARLATAQAQMGRGGQGDDLGEVLNSPIVQELRKQRDEAAKAIAELEGRYGPRHPELMKAMRQRAELDAQIQQEIARIVSNLKLQAQVAQARTDAVASALGAAKGALADSNGASVQLRELERNLEAVRTLYQSFLDRFKQTSAQEGMAQPDSRLVSSAKAPLIARFPNRPLLVAGSALASLIAGLLAVWTVEAIEDGLYCARDVERRLGLTCLSLVPMAGAEPLDRVVDAPSSGFAEAFRALKTGLSHSRAGSRALIAVTSALAGEGKTTTCICLGRVMARAGVSVAVVDCDLRRRTINDVLAGPSRAGLLDVLLGRMELEDALVADRQTDLMFLPLGDEAQAADDILVSPLMERLLERLRARFKVVILDAGPVLMVAETRSLAARADAVLFVARWRRTPLAAARDAVKLLENAGAYIAGAALTQVDPRQAGIRRYGYLANDYPFDREDSRRSFTPAGPRKARKPARASAPAAVDANTAHPFIR